MGIVNSSISSTTGNFLTSGSAYFKEVQTTTTAGVEQDLINETVSAGKKVLLLQSFITCRMEGKWRILIDSDEIASGRTGAAVANSDFSWLPYRQASAGQTVTVKFLARSGSPSADVEAYLQARELDA